MMMKAPHHETDEIQNAMNGRIREDGVFPKKCSCSASYHEAGWLSLPFHGIFRGADESTGRKFSRDLEIRVCHCGSSIAVELKGE
jgi:hypothetical protein